MRSRRYSNEELLAHLRDLADDDQAPTTSEVEDSSGACASTYRLRFGSYTEAVEEAGLEPRPGGDAKARNRQYSDEEMLDWIRSFALEFGVVPRPRDAMSWPGPSCHTYRLRFGSWTDAVREAGLEPATGGDE